MIHSTLHWKISPSIWLFNFSTAFTKWTLEWRNKSVFNILSSLTGSPVDPFGIGVLKIKFEALKNPFKCRCRIHNFDQQVHLKNVKTVEWSYTRCSVARALHTLFITLPTFRSGQLKPWVEVCLAIPLNVPEINLVVLSRNKILVW